MIIERIESKMIFIMIGFIFVVDFELLLMFLFLDFVCGFFFFIFKLLIFVVVCVLGVY